MSDQRSLESEIRQLINSDLDAVSLSNKLFSPGGLFNQMAASEAKRRALVATPLFREAQQKLRTLKRREVEQFCKNVDQSASRRTSGTASR